MILVSWCFHYFMKFSVLWTTTWLPHRVPKIGLIFIGPHLLILAWHLLSLSITIVIFVGWYWEALLGTLLHYLQQLQSIRIQLSPVLRVLTFDILTFSYRRWSNQLFKITWQLAKIFIPVFFGSTPPRGARLCLCSFYEVLLYFHLINIAEDWSWCEQQIELLKLENTNPE